MPSNQPSVAATTSGDTNPSRSRAAAWIWPILLGLASLAAFWGALGHQFVELDDDGNFLRNPQFRGLSREHLAWMWSLDSFHIGHWHPLTWMTFGLDFLLYGLDGPKFHRLSVFVHAASVVSVFFVACELLRQWSARRDGGPISDFALRATAGFAALAWGLHPLRVESVAWVTERRDVLSTFFLLLALWAYLRMCARTAGGGGMLALAVLLYLLSLLCKAWGMTFPLLLLVIDRWVLRREVSWTRLIVEKLAFAPFALFIAVQAARAQAEIAAVVTWQEHGAWARFAQASYGLFWYPLKTLWPSDLSCLVLLEPKLDPTRPIYVASQLGVVAIGVLVWLGRRRWPAAVAALACYAILVSPVLGVLQSGSQKVADRYAHLATIPLLLAVAGGLVIWLAGAREAAGARRRALALCVVCAVLALVLGHFTQRQVGMWRDSTTLFERSIQAQGGNYFLWHNLSVQHSKAGRLQDAIDCERRSIEAHPGKGNEDARYSLGDLLRQQSDLAGAKEAWRGALSVEPEHAPSLRQLCAALTRESDFDTAIAACEASLRLRPRFVEGWMILAGVHQQRGHTQFALDTWQRAVLALPYNAMLNNACGKAFHAAGRGAEAEPFLVDAVTLENRNVEYATDVAALFVDLGRMKDARDLLVQILREAPTHARAKALMERAKP